jgi:hypothetical protein
MLLSAHILTGAAIAAKIQNPILGIFLAFLSHYLLDILPHAEYSIENIKTKQWKKSTPDFFRVFLDAFLGIALIILITNNNFVALLGGLAAMVPDGLTLLFILFPKNKLLKLHQKGHSWLNGFIIKREIPYFWGILSQIAISAVAIYFLLSPQILPWD